MSDSFSSIVTKVDYEAFKSGLPGSANGPLDAYRHALWMAEIARQYGENTAKLVGSLKEIRDQIFERFYDSPEVVSQSLLMDTHNNLVGIQIGLEIASQSGTWEDVVLAIRERMSPQSPGELIDEQNPSAGSYLTWMDDQTWSANQTGAMWNGTNITWHVNGPEYIEEMPGNWEPTRSQVALYLADISGYGFHYADETVGAVSNLFAMGLESAAIDAILSEETEIEVSGDDDPTGTLGEVTEEITVDLNDRTLSCFGDFKQNSGYAWASQGLFIIINGWGPYTYHTYVGGHMIGTTSGLPPEWLSQASYRTRTAQYHAVSDPIVLDLDGDGVELVNVNSSSVYFDTGNSGEFKTRTGWVAADDGMLVLDMNSNGQIDDASEMLHNGEIDALEALAEYDTDSDGKLDSDDTDFANFRIWKDADQDGVTDAGELHTLSSLGIASINVTGTASDTQNEGNTIASTLTYTKTDTSTGNAAEVFFTTDPSNTRYIGDYDLKLETLFLPKMRGGGTVANLHIAMSMDDTLLGMVRDMDEITDISELRGAVQDVLFRWAGVDGMSPDDNGDFDTRKLMTMVRYFGLPEAFFDGMPYEDLPGLEQSWQDLLSEFTRKFAVQGPLKHVFPEATYSFATDDVTLGYESWADLLEAAQGAAPEDAVEAAHYWNLVRGIGQIYAVSQLDSTVGAVATDIVNEILALNVTEAGSYSNPTFDQSDDVLIGTTGADEMDGGFGDDIIFGGAGNDEIIGRAGNDIIIAGGGVNDVRAFEGDDIIVGSNDNGFSYEFLDGDEGNDIIFGGAGRDQINGGADNDTLYGEADDDRMFGWDGNDVMYGGTGHDGLYGYNGDDVLYGGDGDDSLRGDTQSHASNSPEGTGNDTLYGEAGNDYLFGGAADDHLHGGTGNDNLNGEAGSDTYYFNLGDGQDVVQDQITGGDVNTVVFGADIDPYNVTFSQQGNDLRIAVNGTSDHLTVKNWFVDSSWQVATFEFEMDELSIPASQVASIISNSGSLLNFMTGTSSNNTLNGTSGADHISGLGGNDILRGAEGRDFLYGGDGNDTLRADQNSSNVDVDSANDYLDGGAGDDTLYGGGGNDILIGGTGNDALRGEAGSDTYKINLGDGTDNIIDSYEEGKVNKVVFGSGIFKSDFKMYQSSGVNLNIENLASGDKLTFTNWGPNNPIQAFEFTETGESLSIAEAMDGFRTLYGTASSNTMVGTAYVDRLYGLDGNDSLKGAEGDDFLYGGNGNDHLYGDRDASNTEVGSGGDYLDGGAGDDNINGGAGSDTLWGGEGGGNDTLRGDDGGDIYIFKRNDSFDTIIETTNTNSDTDKILFDMDIDYDQLWLQQIGNHLEINIIGTSDTIKITNWFSNANQQVEEIYSGDGYVLEKADVATLVTAMAGFTPPAAPDTEIPSAYRTTLDTTLAAVWQQAA